MTRSHRLAAWWIASWLVLVGAWLTWAPFDFGGHGDFRILPQLGGSGFSVGQQFPGADYIFESPLAVRRWLTGVAAEGAVPVRFSTFGNLPPQQQINTIDRLAATGPGIERVGMQSNALHGYGRSAVVEAVLTGSCRFCDNEASVAGRIAPAAVELSATTIIASANRVTFDREKSSLELQALDKSLFTALGNITTGPIRMNGANLVGTPWEKLNVIAP